MLFIFISSSELLCSALLWVRVLVAVGRAQGRGELARATRLACLFDEASSFDRPVARDKWFQAAARSTGAASSDGGAASPTLNHHQLVCQFPLWTPFL